MCHDSARPLSFETILSDPLIGMVMAADGVSVADLRAVLEMARAARTAHERGAAPGLPAGVTSRNCSSQAVDAARICIDRFCARRQQQRRRRRHGRQLAGAEQECPPLLGELHVFRRWRFVHRILRNAEQSLSREYSRRTLG